MVDTKYQILLDEVRQTYASVVWTHKIQEKQADIYARRYEILMTISIIASAVTSYDVISAIFGHSLWDKKLTACFSLVTLAITGYLKVFDLNNLSNANKVAAKKFVVLRDKLLYVICRIHMKEDFDDIQEKYESVVDDLNELYLDAPSTTNKAVKNASQALKSKREYTYSDEEIDCFLPPTLRGGIE